MTTGNTDALEVELEVLLGSIPVETGEVQITVSAFISQVLPVGDADTLSRGFRFEPSGLQFQEPYPRVTISYTDDEVAGLDESKIDVMVCDSLGENCELAVVESRNTVLNTITIILQHFSDVILCRTDDCDGDGCTNTAEEGSDERVGGLRNMRNRSDYYDINDDQIIDLSNDIFEVIQHYWPDNRAAPNGPGQYPSGYDVFDRGPSPGPNAWDMTDPDGVIDLSNDILGVILQYFHDCRTP